MISKQDDITLFQVLQTDYINTFRNHDISNLWSFEDRFYCWDSLYRQVWGSSETNTSCVQWQANQTISNFVSSIQSHDYNRGDHVIHYVLQPTYSGKAEKTDNLVFCVRWLIKNMNTVFVINKLNYCQQLEPRDLIYLSHDNWQHPRQARAGDNSNILVSHCWWLSRWQSSGMRTWQHCHKICITALHNNLSQHHNN